MTGRPTGLDWNALQPTEQAASKKSRRGRELDLTEDQIAEAVADYLRGLHSHDVGLSLGVSNATVLRWVRAAGHAVRTTAQSKALDRVLRSDA